MASEPTEEGSVTVRLSGELDEWLDEQATKLGVSRETVVEQLLTTYKATAQLDDEQLLSNVDVDEAVSRGIQKELDSTFQDELDAIVAASVDSAVDEAVQTAVESAISDRMPEITRTVEQRLDDRFETLETEFQEKIEDVRERVIQLKREIDTKAPTEHEHEAFDSISEIESNVTEIESDLTAIRADLDDGQAATEDAIEDLEARFDDAEDKLKRVAWVVSDLRDDHGGRDAYQKVVDRLKRAAAQEGVSTATCQNCGEAVDISLLTDPQCPHCSTTVSDVEPKSGLFRKKAKLITASQLEAGDDDV